MENFIFSGFGDEVDMDLDLQMDVFDKLGIKYIEMRGVDGKNIGELTEEEARSIKNRLDARGFKISALGTGIGKIPVTADFDEHMTLFRHIIKLAKILGTRYIRMFSFYPPQKGEDPTPYRDTVISRIKELASEAERQDITLLHENEKGIYGDIPERCCDIIKSVNSPNLRVTFDPANFVQSGSVPYPDAFKQLKDYIEYMHIKDCRASDKIVVPSGSGDGGIKSILQELKNSGFHGFVSLEPHLKHFTGVDSFDTDTKLEKLSTPSSELFSVAASALRRIINSLD